MKLERENRLAVRSRNIFDGSGASPFDGHLVIEGNTIVAVNHGPLPETANASFSRVIDVGDRLVSPGFVDVHTFFTGWAILDLGVDFSGITNSRDAGEAIRHYQKTGGHDFVIGYGWNPEALPSSDDLVNNAFPDVPTVIFSSGRDTCLMNRAAGEKYRFTPEACYAEMIWRLLADCLALPEMREKYQAYMRLLASRGVTSIKEMTFDDYSGFDREMRRLEDEDLLTVRVAMMSQPVGRGIDIDHGRRLSEELRGPFLKFSGYNRMTDRGIGRFLGELIEPYTSRPDIRVATPVEWDLISRETRLADDAGFRFSLHCQGDGAVRHTVDLFASCRMRDGRLQNRHAITDLELTHPDDLDRFGRMGGIAEIYPQIQSLDNKADIMEMIERQLGQERGRRYWNRRRMWDAGITVTCGTDLPLLIPDIPESLYSGCGGRFNDGGEFNKENMLTLSEMLTAWTRNGQYNRMDEDRLGLLAPGYLADIAVLSENVFLTPMDNMRDVSVVLTISDGRIVHGNPDTFSATVEVQQ